MTREVRKSLNLLVARSRIVPATALDRRADLQMKITKRFVEQVEIPSQRHGKPTQTFYRDDELRGFALRVTSGGAKSFVFERRIKGPVRRITLGRFEDLTIARARRKAERMAGEIADDQDPIANRKRTKLERITLGRVLDDYLAARKDLKPRTVEDYRMVTRWGFSDWLARPLTTITKEQVATRHTVLGKRSPARANNAFRVLRALFNYAIALYLGVSTARSRWVTVVFAVASMWPISASLKARVSEPSPRAVESIRKILMFGLKQQSIAKSAVSKPLTDLEKRLGVQLLTRTTRQQIYRAIRPTWSFSDSKQ